MKRNITTPFVILSIFLLNCQNGNIKNKIDFQFVAGVIVVKATLNDSIEGLFQLDSGANNSFIRKKYADEIGIMPAGTLKGPGPGGKIFEAPKAEVLSISMGGHSISLTSCAIVDMKNQEVPDRFIGLIGSDYLKEFIITIDFKDQALLFEDSQSLAERLSSGVKIPIKFNQNAPNIPYISVTINDSILADYIFDTGVPITILSYKDFFSLGLQEDIKNMEKKSKNILNHSFETYTTTVSTFGFDNFIKIHDIEIETCENCNGLIGNNFISNFIITLNYKETYILFDKI